MEFIKLEMFTLLASLVLLTGLMLHDLKPGDAMLVDPKQAINHYEVKRRESWGIKERRPMLQILDGLREDKEWPTLYLIGDSGLSRGAIEQCELVLNLVEKNPLKTPEGYEDFTEMRQCFEKKSLPTVIEEPQQSSTLTNEGHIVPAQASTVRPHPSTALICLLILIELMLVFPMLYLVEVKTRKSLSSEGGQREASITRDLRLGPIENTTRSPESQQSSTLTNEGQTIEPAQTAAVIPHPNTDADHMPDLPKYKMDRLPRGMCIIFNAENFTKEDLEQRDGTQKDVEALLNTFQNQLKFETRVVQDPTKKEYVECLQNIGRMDHSKFDCFVCVILSHGFKGSVFGTDGRAVSIDSLTGLFRGDYVPSLVNKPKLFFIQACQGAYPQESVDIQKDGPTTLPNVSDTLISHATIPGYASFRSARSGSLFIISLCNTINTYYKKKVDLLSMLTMVNERISRPAIEGKWMEIGKQIGNPSHCLRKQIFFNEGLIE